MVTVKRNDIKKFSNKLWRITSQDYKRQLLITLCNLGTKYAQELYGSSSIVVDYQIDEKTGFATITAQGDQIAYIEFGTGEMGRGAYEGELPTQLISFHSNAYDVDVTVHGWTYSYARELGLTETPWKGNAPKAQMWKTAQYLRSIFVDLAKGWWQNESIS